MICPNCGHENVSGADHCEVCRTVLFDLNSPKPSKVQIQRKLLTRSIKDCVRENSFQEISPEASLGDAVETFRKHSAKLSCLLVFDGEEFLGLLTERDILKHVGDSPVCLDTVKVKEMYSPKRPIIKIRNSINYAVQKMSIGGYRSLPIEKKSKIIGTINIRDIIINLCRDIEKI